MTGKGKMTWPDGKIYEGGFLNDKKHGVGKFFYPDGKFMEGDWSNGKLANVLNHNGRASLKFQVSESKVSTS
jgi:hypothetical protein